ncbi:MAG: hypothetical protein BWX66_02116 [Deltaproteobacteria bacterium ADurb.Bin058]|nr:MAG: hypothetical protein BWX66_02116 [Deltaproteobacteria bacterium ADurb.Bin058]
MPSTIGRVPTNPVPAVVPVVPFVWQSACPKWHVGWSYHKPGAAVVGRLIPNSVSHRPPDSVCKKHIGGSDSVVIQVCKTGNYIDGRRWRNNYSSYWPGIKVRRKEAQGHSRYGS